MQVGKKVGQNLHFLHESLLLTLKGGLGYVIVQVVAANELLNQEAIYLFIFAQWAYDAMRVFIQPPFSNGHQVPEFAEEVPKRIAPGTERPIAVC